MLSNVKRKLAAMGVTSDASRVLKKKRRASSFRGEQNHHNMLTNSRDRNLQIKYPYCCYKNGG